MVFWKSLFYYIFVLSNLKDNLIVFILLYTFFLNSSTFGLENLNKISNFCSFGNNLSGGCVVSSRKRYLELSIK
jgi:hypothetical protein